jgi:hypothetical protein
MALRTLVVGSAAALLGVCLILAVVGTAFGQKGNPAPASRSTGAESVGRYQLTVINSQYLYMHDTATGECWRGDGDIWWPMGKPGPKPVEVPKFPPFGAPPAEPAAGVPPK